MGRDELLSLTTQEAWLLATAWTERMLREDQRAARTALLVAVKVWDSKGEVHPGAVFPGLLEPTSPEDEQAAEAAHIEALKRWAGV